MNYTVTVTKHQYCYDIEANSIEEAAKLATMEAEENPSNYCTTCDVEENKEEPQWENLQLSFMLTANTQ